MNTITALKQWLEEKKDAFIELRNGGGGCPTCGYGAEEISAIDWDEMMRQIDEFEETFKTPNAEVSGERSESAGLTGYALEEK